MTDRQEKARDTALALMERWGLFQGPRPWSFGFNKRKRAMGLCLFPSPRNGGRGRIELSIHHIECNDAAMVIDTILHEIAHALAGRPGHDALWRHWCGIVGANPSATSHSGAILLGKYQATCGSCGKVYHYHRRPKHVRGYYCKPCGNVAGALSFAKTG